MSPTLWWGVQIKTYIGYDGLLIELWTGDGTNWAGISTREELLTTSLSSWTLLIVLSHIY